MEKGVSGWEGRALCVHHTQTRDGQRCVQGAARFARGHVGH